jgi:hypothetical protein
MEDYIQRVLNDFFANFFDERKRDATAIIVDAIAAKQMLFGHGFDSLLVYHRGVPQENANPLIQNAVKFAITYGRLGGAEGS